jgi:hypothetical protein
MTAAPRLAGFAGALALLLGGGALAGGVIDPTPPNGTGATAATQNGARSMGRMTAASDAHGAGKNTRMTMAPRGLAVAEHGLRLVVDRSSFARGQMQQLRFHIVNDKGATVRDFDVEHTKRMHLIVVRRDFEDFQHLHPVEDSAGNWTVALRLDDPGSYRMFADFSHGGRATTLADDLTVDGPFRATALPRPVAIAEAGSGYRVRLEAAHTAAGQESPLRFTVLRDGRPVQVEPYLGADGHLVALRGGDLAFLHVHPTGGGSDRQITFDATFPTTSTYRLFLQFKVDGRVHTAAFTQDVS